MLSHFSMFALLPVLLGACLKKSSPKPISWTFSLMFDSKTFTILGLAFVFHPFQFIFVWYETWAQFRP